MGPRKNKKPAEWASFLNKFRVPDQTRQSAGGLRVGVGSRGTHLNRKGRIRHPESELNLTPDSALRQMMPLQKTYVHPKRPVFLNPADYSGSDAMISRPPWSSK